MFELKPPIDIDIGFSCVFFSQHLCIIHEPPLRLMLPKLPGLQSPIWSFPESEGYPQIIYRWIFHEKSSILKIYGVYGVYGTPHLGWMCLQLTPPPTGAPTKFRRKRMRLKSVQIRVLLGRGGENIKQICWGNSVRSQESQVGSMATWWCTP